MQREMRGKGSGNTRNKGEGCKEKQKARDDENLESKKRRQYIDKESSKKQELMYRVPNAAPL